MRQVPKTWRRCIHIALTRRIIASHGGQLTAKRNPEGGSTFTFTLPEA